MEVAGGQAALVRPRECVSEVGDAAILVGESVLVAAVAGHVDLLEGADLVAVFVAVVGIESGVEIGAQRTYVPGDSSWRTKSKSPTCWRSAW